MTTNFQKAKVSIDISRLILEKFDEVCYHDSY